MMDDHELVCQARNSLCDALKTLLNPEIMKTPEFLMARNQTQLALKTLDKLLELSVYS